MYDGIKFGSRCGNGFWTGNVQWRKRNNLDRILLSEWYQVWDQLQRVWKLLECMRKSLTVKLIDSLNLSFYFSWFLLNLWDVKQINSFTLIFMLGLLFYTVVLFCITYLYFSLRNHRMRREGTSNFRESQQYKKDKNFESKANKIIRDCI